MPLFSGVENFSPALEGQRISIGAGQGAGASISRGTAARQHGEAQNLNEQEFKFKKQVYKDTQPTIEDLSRMFDFLRNGMP